MTTRWSLIQQGSINRLSAFGLLEGQQGPNYPHTMDAVDLGGGASTGGIWRAVVVYGERIHEGDNDGGTTRLRVLTYLELPQTPSRPDSYNPEFTKYGGMSSGSYTSMATGPANTSPIDTIITSTGNVPASTDSTPLNTTRFGTSICRTNNSIYDSPLSYPRVLVASSSLLATYVKRYTVIGDALSGDNYIVKLPDPGIKPIVCPLGVGALCATTDIDGFSYMNYVFQDEGDIIIGDPGYYRWNSTGAVRAPDTNEGIEIKAMIPVGQSNAPSVLCYGLLRDSYIDDRRSYRKQHQVCVFLIDNSAGGGWGPPGMSHFRREPFYDIDLLWTRPRWMNYPEIQPLVDRPDEYMLFSIKGPTVDYPAGWDTGLSRFTMYQLDIDRSNQSNYPSAINRIDVVSEGIYPVPSYPDPNFDELDDMVSVASIATSQNPYNDPGFMGERAWVYSGLFGGVRSMFLTDPPRPGYFFADASEQYTGLTPLEDELLTLPPGENATNYSHAMAYFPDPVLLPLVSGLGPREDRRLLVIGGAPFNANTYKTSLGAWVFNVAPVCLPRNSGTSISSAIVGPIKSQPMDGAATVQADPQTVTMNGYNIWCKPDSTSGTSSSGPKSIPYPKRRFE